MNQEIKLIFKTLQTLFQLVNDRGFTNNYYPNYQIIQLQYTQFMQNSFAFDMSRNLDKNLTNYYNLIYKYKNDCLEASAVFNKQFYDDSDVNSGKNIFFKISFIPFGTVNTPNLND